jgi:hypothetical protein
MSNRIVNSVMMLASMFALTTTTHASGLDLEGFKPVSEEVDDGTFFHMKAIVYEVRRAVFPGDDVPKEVKAAAAAFCRGFGEPIEVAKESKSKDSYVVAYRCNDPDQSTKLYAISPIADDWVKCDAVAAVSQKRAQASMAALSTSQKSALVLNCESEGWVRLNNPGGGTGARPEVTHLFLGDRGEKVCRSIEAEFRTLAPQIADKKKWDRALTTTDKYCPKCGPSFDGTSPAVILSDFIRKNRSCVSSTSVGYDLWKSRPNPTEVSSGTRAWTWEVPKGWIKSESNGQVVYTETKPTPQTPTNALIVLSNAHQKSLHGLTDAEALKYLVRDTEKSVNSIMTEVRVTDSGVGYNSSVRHFWIAFDTTISKRAMKGITLALCANRGLAANGLLRLNFRAFRREPPSGRVIGSKASGLC